MNPIDGDEIEFPLSQVCCDKEKMAIGHEEYTSLHERCPQENTKCLNIVFDMMELNYNVGIENNLA